MGYKYFEDVVKREIKAQLDSTLVEIDKRKKYLLAAENARADLIVAFICDHDFKSEVAGKISPFTCTKCDWTHFDS